MQALAIKNEIRFIATGHGIQDLQVQVYAITGKSIYQSGWQSNGFTWTLDSQNGQHVANGVYLYTVTVRGENNKIVKTKLQKLIISQDSKKTSLPAEAFSITATQAVIASNAVHFLASGRGSFKDMKVIVFDLNGKLIYASDWERNGLAWALEDNNGLRIAKGVYLYILTARSQMGEMTQSKLQKLVVK
jgi:hypothetical protein